MTKNQKILLALVIGLAAFLIFFRLTRHDLLGDDAHYAFRSIGYFDFMASKQQTTPVQWFGYRPWWSYLSFHDHPPLYFLIHYVVFKLFGVSVLMARIPTALAALGLAAVVFFMVKRLSGTFVAALLSSVFLAVNNYFIWTGRIGLLEGIFVFLAVLGISFLIRGLQEKRFLVWSGVFFGLAFLTKYTLLFFFPAIVLYLIIWERRVFRRKEFWAGLLLMLVLALPVVVYNWQMWQTRGHFDVQFDRIFPADHHDWDILKGQSPGWSFSGLAAARTLADGFGYPYFLALLAGTATLLYLVKRNFLPKPALLFPLVLFSLWLGLGLAGGADRWLGVTAPFAAVILGLSTAKVFERFRAWKLEAAFLTVLAGLGAYSIFYTVNSNHAKRPWTSPAHYADFRTDNLGYNQLDARLSQLLSGATSSPETKSLLEQWWYASSSPETVKLAGFDRSPEKDNYQPFVLYDSNTDWFPDLWTFEKWKLHHKIVIMTVNEFAIVVKNEADHLLDVQPWTDIYFIKAGETVASRSRIKFPEIDLFLQNYKQMGIQPELIYDDQGRVAFYVYHQTVPQLR